MTLAAIVCNAVLAAFTCVVLVTDGAPTDAPYIALTILVLLVPILSAVTILRAKLAPSSAGGLLARGTLAGNVVLVGASCWAIAAQYPHPREDGLLAYMLLVLATPILSFVVVLRRLRSGRPNTTS